MTASHSTTPGIQYFGRCDTAHSRACSIGARGGSEARKRWTVGSASIVSRHRQKAGYFGYIGFTFLRQAEGKGARHEIEVRKREVGA